MITHLSWRTFAPFDLGARLPTGKDRDALDRVLSQHGWTRVSLSPAMAGALGGSHHAYAAADAKIVIPPSGFAVLILAGEEQPFTLQRPFSPTIHLDRRRRRHRRLLGEDGAAALPDGFDATVIALRSALADCTPRHLRRLEDQRILHYVMSAYFARTAPGGIDQLSPDTRRALRACLQPSLLELDDTPFLGADLTAIDLGAALAQVPDDLTAFGDHDCAADTALLASWSSVFATGNIDPELVDLISGLQVRVQSSWLAAWTVGDISRRLVDEIENRHISSRRIEWLTVELAHLRTATQSRVDASESERIAGIARALYDTSGLEQEWSQAMQALHQAQSYAALVNADANYRSQVAVEILLLIFAFSSLAPIVLRVPITSWSDISDQWAPMLILIVVLVIGIVLVVRRRR